MANPIIRVILSAVDDVTDVAKKSTKGLQGFGESALSLGKTIGAVFVTGAIAQFFKSTIDEAAEGRLGMERLGLAVEKAGGNFDDLGPSLEASVAKVQKLSTATDDELRAALTNMITITGDVAASQDNLQLAADLAAKKHISLEEASTLVGKAMEGNTKGLKDLGINTKDAGEAIEQLRAKVGGFAQVEAQSFTGGMKRAWNQLGEVKEAIGNVILSNGELGGSTGRVADLFGSLALYIEKNEEKFGLLMDVVSSTVGQLGAAASAVWDVIGPAVTWLAQVALGGLVLGLQTVAFGLRVGIDKWKEYAGAIAETLGEIIEKGGKVLKAFGISIGEETGKSLSAWGRNLKESARRDADEATDAYWIAMDKFQQARTTKAKEIERADETHEGNKSNLLRAGIKEREAEEEKAARKKKAHDDKVAKDTLKGLEEANRNLQAAMQKRNDDIESAVTTLQDILSGKLGNATAQALGITTKAMEELLAALKGKIPSEQWDALNAAVQAHKTKLGDLLPPATKFSDAVKEAADANKDMGKETLKAKDALDKAVRSGADLARAFVDAASATGIIDDKMANVLNSAISLASSLPKAFSGDPAAIAQAVTSLANIIVGVGSSETEKRRAAAATANTAAIDRLTREVGNLNLRESGKVFAGVQSAVDASVQARADARASGKGPGDADKAAKAAFLKSLASQGIGVDEARRLFKEMFGRELSMANAGTFFQDIAAFQEGLQNTEFGQFGSDFEGQLDALTKGFDIFGTTDDDNKLQEFVQLAGNFSPALKEALGGDLSTPEGRAKATANLQALFQKLKSGGLKPEDIGVSGQQFLSLLQSILPLLAGADGQLQGGSSVPAGTTSSVASLPAAVAASLASVPASGLSAWSNRPGLDPALAGSPSTATTGPGGWVLQLEPGAITANLNFPNATNLEEVTEETVDQIAVILGQKLRMQLAARGLPS